MAAAAAGAVLVSARIAKGEQDIVDTAISRGFPVVTIEDNGFPELYHPSEQRTNLCNYPHSIFNSLRKKIVYQSSCPLDSSNYFLNRVWTFRSHEKQVAVEYPKFILVSVIGLGINNGTLWLTGRLLPDWSGDWRFYILWVFAVGVTTLWNFFGNMLFTFRKS